MKAYFSKKAETGLEKNFSHVVENFSIDQAQIVQSELVSSILKLSELPELGSKIAGQADKRILFVSGNAIIYEIVLKKDPYIMIRNIKPRKTF